MDLSIEKNGEATIIRIQTARVIYPLLPTLVARTREAVDSGARSLVLDLGTVSYIDSATIGCFMDLYRQMSSAGGQLKLAGVQKRVETMLTMTGAQNFIDVHQDEVVALDSFGGKHAHD